MPGGVGAGGENPPATRLRNLADLYQLTIVIITHDLDFLWQVTDRVAVLGEGRVVGTGSMAELAEMTHPIIREYFDGPRSRAAQEQAQKETRIEQHTQEDRKEGPWIQK